MSDQLPKISITSHNSSESSDYSSSENDMDYDRNKDALTDVEDLDSQAASNRSRSRKSSFAKLALPKGSSSADNDATDIEDYNDSDADEEEKSKIYPELKMSLQEFLCNGLQEQAWTNNETKEHIQIMPGNFLQAQNLNNMMDYLTDCEDYNTDSELEEPMQKSVCVDLDEALEDQGKTSITDATRKNKKPDFDNNSDEFFDVSVLSDISEAVPGLSDAYDGANGASEDELLELSGDEEVCQIQYSGSSSDDDEGANNLCVPAIDVMFFPLDEQTRKLSISSRKSQKAFLDVASCNEEVLTDIERLDDSAAEEDSFDEDEDDAKPIPRAVILAPGDDGTCLTETEDVCFDDLTAMPADIIRKTVDFELLPPAQREIVVLKEDRNGDTITQVMPMENEFRFGMYKYQADDTLTDSEDVSCAEDWDTKNVHTSAALPSSSFIESEFIVSSDTLKPVATKRSELKSNAESVTDVEEIFLAGTNRRKKLKTRTLSKGKSKFLDIKPNEDDGGSTDVEEMGSSNDCGKKPLAAGSNNRQQYHTETGINAEKVTDQEDITDDGISDVSDIDAPQENPNILDLTDYNVNSANIVYLIERDGLEKNMNKVKSNIKIDITKQQQYVHQELTDSEDMQLPSDTDDVLDSAKESSCSSRELNEMLNESCTFVHEKSGNSFDVEAEKLHIKGMQCRDVHTDIEYLESDESAARGGN